MSLAIRYTDQQARRLILWIIALECFFALAYVVIHILHADLKWGPLRPLFNLDGESSLPTWTAVVKLFAVGVLLFIAAQNNRQRALLPNAVLLIAGLVFFWLSADEQSQLHENLTYQSRRLGLDEVAFIGPWAAWIYAYAVIGLVGLVVCWRYVEALWRNFRPVAVVGLVGVVLFVAGAVGFEAASFPFRDSADTHTVHLVMIAIEELLEMVGVTVILYATLILANRLSDAR